MQKKSIWNSKSMSISPQVLYTYFHQIENVEFIFDSHPVHKTIDSR